MTKENEAAFSKSAFYHESYGEDDPQKGLTKREYFAVMAMQSFIIQNSYGMNEIPLKSISIADALIKQLNNQQ